MAEDKDLFFGGVMFFIYRSCLQEKEHLLLIMPYGLLAALYRFFCKTSALIYGVFWLDFAEVTLSVIPASFKRL